MYYSCEGMIERSVPRDHHLSPRGKPQDAKRRSSGRIFCPILTLMIDSNNLTHVILPRLSHEGSVRGCIGTHAHGRQVT